MWPNPQKTADLVTFTEEILSGKLHFLCSDGSIFFMENANPIYFSFIIFLLTICRCERLWEIKEKKYYWQPMLSAIICNNFRYNLDQNMNFKFEWFFSLYLWIDQVSQSKWDFFDFTFKIGAHPASEKSLDIQMIYEKM